MSAAELIEKIKALPPGEQEIVRNFVLNGQDESSDSRSRYASDQEFQDAAGRVFEKHEEVLLKLAQ
ncbi:MAG: hypothetical protein ABI946_03605 [Chthoniobacterales bacterium]